ncbi:hypothetical protein [Staphylococcus saccharolyticus]|nr:hypothetical protein [Staphylococcus saccharolyticus]
MNLTKLSLSRKAGTWRRSSFKFVQQLIYDEHFTSLYHVKSGQR